MAETGGRRCCEMEQAHCSMVEREELRGQRLGGGGQGSEVERAKWWMGGYQCPSKAMLYAVIALRICAGVQDIHNL